MADGVEIPVYFGAQFEAAVEVAEVAPEVSTEPAPETADAADEISDDSSGLPANIGLIVIGVAIALVVLAGVGVVLLRRS